MSEKSFEFERIRGRFTFRVKFYCEKVREYKIGTFCVFRMSHVYDAGSECVNTRYN